MADHDVRLTTKNLLVKQVDLEFTVKIDAKMRGTLSISEGGLHWRPSNYSKKNGIPISWSEFADWAEGS